MDCDGELTWWVLCKCRFVSNLQGTTMLEIAALSALVPVRGFAFALVLSVSPVTWLAYGNFGEAVLQIWIWSWRRSLGLENWSCECAEFDCCECHVIGWSEMECKVQFLFSVILFEWQLCMSIPLIAGICHFSAMHAFDIPFRFLQLLTTSQTSQYHTPTLISH